MVNLRDVATTTLGLAWRGAVPLVGVAILLGMSSGRAPAPPGDVQGTGPGGELARDEDGTLRVTLVVPEGEANARCVVRAGNGVDLMRIYYSLNGTL